jgi:hypothetical protein
MLVWPFRLLFGDVLLFPPAAPAFGFGISEETLLRELDRVEVLERVQQRTNKTATLWLVENDYPVVS